MRTLRIAFVSFVSFVSTALHAQQTAPLFKSGTRLIVQTISVKDQDGRAVAIGVGTRVRRAFNLAFDFEWANANLFSGAYRRTRRSRRGLPEPAETPARAATPR